MADLPTENALVSQPGTELITAVPVFRRAAEVWAQPAVKRSLPLLVVVVLTAVAFGLYSFMKEPTLRVLFPDLVDADKALVLETLKKRDIKAHIDQASGLVQVPEKDYHRAKVMLAENGLPRTVASGYDLLTQMPIGVSQSVEQARLTQSQETEIAHSIEAIDAVSAARVHLAIPPRSALVREHPEARASVMLKIAGGRNLDEGQISAIVHLVSSSVPFLQASNVAVIDQYGKLLSSTANDPGVRASDEQVVHQRTVERMYRDRVIGLLSPIVGYQNLTAEVTATIDFTKSESTSERYEDPGHLRSEQESTTERSEPSARGVPGTLTNTPPNAAALTTTPPAALPADQAAAAAAPTSRTSNRTRNFEVGRELRTVQASSAHLSRLSVAVIVRAPQASAAQGADKKDAKSGADDQDAAPVAEPLDAKQLTSLVRDAIGYDDERGDSVMVSILPFADALAPDSGHWYEATWVADSAKALCGVLLIGVLTFGLLRPMAPRLFDSPAVLSAADSSALLQESQVAETPLLSAGESLEELKAKLKPKKSGISAEMLDTANTYDDKVALVRMLVSEDAARVTNVFRQLMNSEIIS